MEIAAYIKSVLKKQFLHQISFVTAGSLINGASLFLLNILLARNLSQDIFGVFSLSVMVLSVVAEMSDFGLNAGLLRFAPYYLATNQEDKFKQIVKTILRWRLVLSLLLSIGGLALSYPIARYILGQVKVAPYLTYTSLGIGGVVLLGFIATFLQAKQRFFYNAALQSLKGVLRLSAALIFMVLGIKNVLVYLSVYIFVPWILFFLNFKVLPKDLRKTIIEDDVRKKLHSQLVRFSFWLTVSSLVAIFYSRVDQVMISHYLGLSEVAVFTVAWQLLQFFPIISSSITSVLMPKISSLHEKDDLIIFLKRSFKWLILGVFGLAILVYPSQYLITFLFGQKYLQAMPIYVVLSYSTLLNILIIPFSLVIIIFHRTYITIISNFIQLVILVGCNFTFIPVYGMMGAAYTFAVSNVVLFLFTSMYAVYLIKKKDFKID